MQNEHPRNADVALLSEYLELYRHHFSLLVRSAFLYFAIVGGAVGYVFRDTTSTAAMRALMLLIFFMSLLCAVGGGVLLVWVRDFSKLVHGVQERLGEPKMPFGAPRVALVVFTIVLFTIAAGSAVTALTG